MSLQYIAENDTMMSICQLILDLGNFSGLLHISLDTAVFRARLT